MTRKFLTWSSAYNGSGSQTLHTTVTSFFRSLHTKGKICHFIPRHFISKSLHTSQFIPSHFIPSHFIPKSLHTNHFIPVTSYQSLHTNALHIRARHTDIYRYLHILIVLNCHLRSMLIFNVRSNLAQPL